MFHSRFGALAPFVFLAFGGTSAGQDISIADQNVQFGVEFNATPVVYANVADYFRADPNGGSAGILFKSAWAYRIDSDVRETIFNDGGGQATFSSNANVGVATWTDVENRGAISATLTYTATSLGLASGYLTAEMQITNISSNPVTVDLYHLSDFDIGTSYLTNMVTTGNNGNQRYWDGAVSEFGSQGAIGADHWEVGSYSNTQNPSAGSCTYTSVVDLYTRLENSTADTLRGDLCLWGPLDVRGAFQWSGRVLAPNQSETFVLVLGHNTDACLASETSYGSALGGAGGVPTISSANGAVLGTDFIPTIDNCPAGAPSYIMLGLAPISVPLNDLTILTLPQLGILNVTADSFGHAEPAQGIPVPSDPSFCGVTFFGQALVTDLTSTSTSGLPFTHTDGIAWTVGAIR